MSTTLTGYHAVEEAIRSGTAGALLLVSRGGRRIDELIGLARSKGIEVKREKDAALARLCGHHDHRGFVLTVDKPVLQEGYHLGDFVDSLQADASLVIILDGVTDPQNLGAVMRSADQFAADLLIIPQRRAAHENETVARASSGASAYVPLVVATNLVQAAGVLKEHGFWVYGADVGGKIASKVDLRGRTAVILGSEGRGISRLLRERCDDLIKIDSKGHVDSFNVSVAAGILMYEVRRQQWE
jgi:23S rRNA (guanosine2251-2'-O)-methyltransferase